jgi:hypothetical protein
VLGVIAVAICLLIWREVLISRSLKFPPHALVDFTRSDRQSVEGKHASFMFVGLIDRPGGTATEQQLN